MSDIFVFLQSIQAVTAVDPFMFVVLTFLLACGWHGLFRCNYLRNTAIVDIKHFGSTVITVSLYMRSFHYVITALGRRKHRTSIGLLAFTSMIAALLFETP
jgi:hypothetical protein